jgi:6-phosphogluconolactonase
MAPRIFIGETPQLAERLAAIVAADAEAAIAGRGFFAIALSGGSVASSFFPRLALAPVDWSRALVFWADERAVPPADPESNYGAARGLLLEPAAIPPQRIHRMEGDAPDLARAAVAYGEAMEGLLGTPPRLDLVVLGVGPDGHVASLFPGHPLLLETQRTAMPVEDAPKPPPRRLTLTLPVLTAAAGVVIAAMGSAKADMIGAALEDPDSPLPVARVVRGAARVDMLLDAEAAARLPPV